MFSAENPILKGSLHLLQKKYPVTLNHFLIELVSTSMQITNLISQIILCISLTMVLDIRASLIKENRRWLEEIS